MITDLGRVEQCLPIPDAALFLPHEALTNLNFGTILLVSTARYNKYPKY